MEGFGVLKGAAKGAGGVADAAQAAKAAKAAKAATTTVAGSKTLKNLLDKNLPKIQQMAKSADNTAAAGDLAAVGKKVDKVGGAAKVAKKGIGAKIIGASEKLGKMCKDNPKSCAGSIAAVGVAAYAAEKYKNATKEQKDCLALCYPEDWHDYKNGEIDEPNYKIESGYSLIDTSLSYANYYPDLKDDLCTPETLAAANIASGKQSCDQFCEKKCDFDLEDVIEDTAYGITSGVSGTAAAAVSGTLDGVGLNLDNLGILFEQYGLYGGFFCAILCVIAIVVAFT
tara:strand:- start:8695 stop:9546 length:852 start_codon:yes stop_codon:yes gene_type:complete